MRFFVGVACVGGGGVALAAIVGGGVGVVSLSLVLVVDGVAVVVAVFVGLDAITPPYQCPFSAPYR